jgi:hypothetical protein
MILRKAGGSSLVKGVSYNAYSAIFRLLGKYQTKLVLLEEQ